MKINYKQTLKFIWVLSCVAVLFFHFDQCLEWDSQCYPAGERMFSAMFLLSFPGSLLYLVFLALTFETVNVHTPLFYILLWSGAFTVGYLQWFRVLPEILNRPELTTLGLAQTRAAIVSAAGGKRATRSRRKRRRVAWLRGERVVHFDETGRTPLERVIRDNQAAG